MVREAMYNQGKKSFFSIFWKTTLWEITQLAAVQERVAAVHLRRKYEEETFPKKVQCRINC